MLKMKVVILLCGIFVIQCSSVLSLTTGATTRSPNLLATDQQTVFQPVSGCLSTAFACLVPLNGSLEIALGPTVDLSAACRTFQETRQCYKTATASCNSTDTLPSDSLVERYEYTCTPAGSKNFKLMSQCFANQEALNAMANCSNLSGIELTGCGIPKRLISCQTTVGKRYCSQEALIAITEIMKASLTPFVNAYNCDLSSILGDAGDDDGGEGGRGPNRGCLSTAFACLVPLNGSLEIALGPTVDLSAACRGCWLGVCCVATARFHYRTFQETRQCYKTATASCNSTDTLPSDSLVERYEYTCTPAGSKNFKLMSQCFANQEALNAMANCSNLSDIELTGCGIPKRLISCQTTVGKRYCSQEALIAITEIMKASLTPFVNAYNCDLSSILGDAGDDDGGEGNTAAISSLHATLLMLAVAMCWRLV